MGTPLGRVISLMVMTCIVLYTIQQFHAVIERENVSFSGKTKTADSKFIDMEELKDSGRLVIGTSNTSIDLFDNPYIRIAAYKLSQTYELNEELKLKKCTKEDISQMMSDNLATFYPNSLCLA